jgi:hypothetical protein
MPAMYRTIDPSETQATLDALHRRINERFPGSNLGRVCTELLSVAEASSARAASIERPYYGLRVIAAAIVVASLGALIYSVSLLDISLAGLNVGELVQATDAGLNTFVLIGAAIFFVVTFETRLKRARALQALNELRSIAHVIDMHQLTKDPVIHGVEQIATESSPVRNLTDFQLARYLDYCSEMLALTGKVAALYAQGSSDGAVISAVNEVEVLTTGLSVKIWNKISAIHAAHPID